MNSNLLNMLKAPSLSSQTIDGTHESIVPKVNVWLVDDSDRLRTLVGELLEREGGIQCSRHFSGPDELFSTLASEPGPDVILLDVQMGDHNGLDAVSPIKALTPSTRVMMFTTCFDSERRERALSEGASDYLLKSYPMKKVADRIRCPADDVKPQLQRRAVPTFTRRVAEPNGTPWMLERMFGMFRAVRN